MDASESPNGRRRTGYPERSPKPPSQFGLRNADVDSDAVATDEPSELTSQSGGVTSFCNPPVRYPKVAPPPRALKERINPRKKSKKDKSKHRHWQVRLLRPNAKCQVFFSPPVSVSLPLLARFRPLVRGLNEDVMAIREKRNHVQPVKRRRPALKPHHSPSHNSYYPTNPVRFAQPIITCQFCVP